MTDKYHSLTVVLDHDMRDDDAQSIILAIGMIRGVTSVDGAVADHVSHMAVERAKRELEQSLLDVVYHHKGKTP
jgi:inosine-uridine nucleoside N-ribohydrolase